MPTESYYEAISFAMAITVTHPIPFIHRTRLDKAASFCAKKRSLNLASSGHISKQNLHLVLNRYSNTKICNSSSSFVQFFTSYVQVASLGFIHSSQSRILNPLQTRSNHHTRLQTRANRDTRLQTGANR